MRKKRPARNRAQEAVTQAWHAIEAAGWKVIRQRENGEGRFVARRQVFERDDESVTSLYESDYTVEGLAVNVTRREREEGRKS